MPNSIRPGDVLADRYRLVDLLVESGGGRFWRAQDRVLDRHVALHVLAADDERADGLLEAARRSATVQDRRLLRVLDADRVDGFCYVVNEWGSGSSLDIMLATDGPMAPRRAAWLVSEVAASVAAGHAAGVAHGRLVPENVLVDGTGSIRIIGYSVDAALHGLPPGRLAADVTDLGALLYAALTGRWAGVSPSDVPGAPDEHGRVLRPRQVRAGIPRTLDHLCDQLVNPYAEVTSRNGFDLGSARGITDYLREFVGDPAGLATAEARQQTAQQTAQQNAQAGQQGGGFDGRTTVLPALPTGTTTAFRAPRARPEQEPPEPGGDAETQIVTEIVDDAAPPDPAPEPAETTHPVVAGPPVEPDQVEPEQVEPGQQVGSEDPGDPEDEVATGPQQRVGEPDRSAAELPTQAGMPVFDDENDEVSWLRARSTPPPPPPPFEEIPERPLFAPEPTDGQPARKPRPNAVASTDGRDYWPWDTGTGTGAGTGSGVIPVAEDDEEQDDEVPGRNWMRLALVLGLSLLLLVAVVVTFNLGRGRTPLGAVPDEHHSTPSSTPSASAKPITGLAATDLDPQGSPPEENPDLAPLAVDGDPSTAWRTMTYKQNFGPGGLKTGVGLVIDLGAVHDVASVDLTFLGQPTSASLYVSGQQPTSVAGMTPVAKVKATGGHAHATLAKPARGRYLTVWLTSLPLVSGGYRGEVAEVAVRG